jgi:hypothetical protein
MTRDCFELEASFLVLRSLAARCEGFVAVAAIADDKESCFFVDRDIGILHSVQGGVAPHHRSPASAMEPAGLDLWALDAPAIGNSTALVAAKCQSYLDNFIARFAQVSSPDEPIRGLGVIQATVTWVRIALPPPTSFANGFLRAISPGQQTRSLG